MPPERKPTPSAPKKRVRKAPAAPKPRVAPQAAKEAPKPAVRKAPPVATPGDRHYAEPASRQPSRARSPRVKDGRSPDSQKGSSPHEPIKVVRRKKVGETKAGKPVYKAKEGPKHRVFKDAEDYSAYDERRETKNAIRKVDLEQATKAAERETAQVREDYVKEFRKDAGEQSKRLQMDKTPKAKADVEGRKTERKRLEREAPYTLVKRADGDPVLEKAKKRKRKAVRKKVREQGKELQREHKARQFDNERNLDPDTYTPVTRRQEKAMANTEKREIQKKEIAEVRKLKDKRSEKVSIGSLARNAKDEIVDAVVNAPNSIKEMTKVAAEQTGVSRISLTAARGGKPSKPATERMVKGIKENDPLYALIKGDVKEAGKRAKAFPLTAASEIIPAAGGAARGVTVVARAGKGAAKGSSNPTGRTAFGDTPSQTAADRARGAAEEVRRGRAKSLARPDREIDVSGTRATDRPTKKVRRKEAARKRAEAKDAAAARSEGRVPENGSSRTYSRRGSIRSIQKAAERVREARGEDPYVVRGKRAQKAAVKQARIRTRNINLGGIAREETAAREVRSAQGKTAGRIKPKMHTPTEKAAIHLKTIEAVRDGSEIEDLRAVRATIEKEGGPHAAENLRIIDTLIEDGALIKDPKIRKAADRIQTESRAGDVRQARAGYADQRAMDYVRVLQGPLLRGEVIDDVKPSGEGGGGPPSGGGPGGRNPKWPKKWRSPGDFDDDALTAAVARGSEKLDRIRRSNERNGKDEHEYTALQRDYLHALQKEKARRGEKPKPQKSAWDHMSDEDLEKFIVSAKAGETKAMGKGDTPEARKFKESWLAGVAERTKRQSDARQPERVANHAERAEGEPEWGEDPGPDRAPDEDFEPAPGPGDVEYDSAIDRGGHDPDAEARAAEVRRRLDERGPVPEDEKWKPPTKERQDEIAQLTDDELRAAYEDVKSKPIDQATVTERGALLGEARRRGIEDHVAGYEERKPGEMPASERGDTNAADRARADIDQMIEDHIGLDPDHEDFLDAGAETYQQMRSEGVDVNDPAAVRAWINDDEMPEGTVDPDEEDGPLAGPDLVDPDVLRDMDDGDLSTNLLRHSEEFTELFSRMEDLVERHEGPKAMQVPAVRRLADELRGVATNLQRYLDEASARLGRDTHDEDTLSYRVAMTDSVEDVLEDIFEVLDDDAGPAGAQPEIDFFDDDLEDILAAGGYGQGLAAPVEAWRDMDGLEDLDEGRLPVEFMDFDVDTDRRAVIFDQVEQLEEAAIEAEIAALRFGGPGEDPDTRAEGDGATATVGGDMRETWREQAKAAYEAGRDLAEAKEHLRRLEAKYGPLPKDDPFGKAAAKKRSHRQLRLAEAKAEAVVAELDAELADVLDGKGAELDEMWGAGMTERYLTAQIDSAKAHLADYRRELTEALLEDREAADFDDEANAARRDFNQTGMRLTRAKALRELCEDPLDCWMLDQEIEAHQQYMAAVAEKFHSSSVRDTPRGSVFENAIEGELNDRRARARAKVALGKLAEQRKAQQAKLSALRESTPEADTPARAEFDREVRKMQDALVDVRAAELHFADEVSRLDERLADFDARLAAQEGKAREYWAKESEEWEKALTAEQRQQRTQERIERLEADARRAHAVLEAYDGPHPYIQHGDSAEAKAETFDQMELRAHARAMHEELRRIEAEIADLEVTLDKSAREGVGMWVEPEGMRSKQKGSRMELRFDSNGRPYMHQVNSEVWRDEARETFSPGEETQAERSARVRREAAAEKAAAKRAEQDNFLPGDDTAQSAFDGDQDYTAGWETALEDAGSDYAPPKGHGNEAIQYRNPEGRARRQFQPPIPGEAGGGPGAPPKPPGGDSGGSGGASGPDEGGRRFTDGSKVTLEALIDRYGDSGGFVRGRERDVEDDRRLHSPTAGTGYTIRDLIGPLGEDRVFDSAVEREQRLTLKYMTEMVKSDFAARDHKGDVMEFSADHKAQAEEYARGLRGHVVHEARGDDGKAIYWILPAGVDKLLKRQLNPPGFWESFGRWTTRHMIRATLPFSVLWHAGNTTDQVLRLALTLSPQELLDSGEIADVLQSKMRGIHPDVAEQILGPLMGHAGSRQTVRDPKLADALGAIPKVGDKVAGSAPARAAAALGEVFNYGGKRSIDPLFDLASRIESATSKGAGGMPNAFGASARRYAEDLGYRVRADQEWMDKFSEELMTSKPHQEELQRRVLEITGDFVTRRAGDRVALAGLDPFWQWFKSANKFVFLTLPTQSPIRTAMLFAAANATRDERLKLGLNFYVSDEEADELALKLGHLGYRSKVPNYFGGGFLGVDEEGKLAGSAAVPLSSFGEAAKLLTNPASAPGRIGGYFARPAGTVSGDLDPTGTLPERGSYRTIPETLAKGLPGGGKIDDLELPGTAGGLHVKSNRLLGQGLDATVPLGRTVRQVREGGGTPLPSTNLVRPRVQAKSDKGNRAGLDRAMNPAHKQTIPGTVKAPTAEEIERRGEPVRAGAHHRLPSKQKRYVRAKKS